ncbi:hypothetical protein L3X37_13085 [Sabulilitoribacter arenilitoris]|uniref:Lipocalin-like domain-containing protein n=1 Tax=Wocania arenilitoris TaxID=2044858 RepID=A0AAE3JQK8_9FLAO|nr:hypothetical protein [Wocania arenilitoris]MCF7569290.1 hypothetical protein [Wocania arenilitoris]
MKKSVIFVLSCFFVFSSCSLNESDSSAPQEIEYYWHLIQVTGGVAGIDERFDVDTIVWNFDDDTGTLTVDNNNTDDSIEDGLDGGTYSFSVLDIDGNTYLLVDDEEIGSFNVNQSTFTLDTNKMSTGTGADGFIYLFQLETRAVTGS